MATCRDCSVPIVFVRMATGTAMPCCPGPDDHGNIACRREGGRFVAGRVLTAGQDPEPGEVRLLAHWAVCTRTRARTRPVKAAAPEPPALF